MSSLYVTGVVEYRNTVFEFHGHQQSLQNEKKKKESQGFESFVFSSFTYRHRSFICIEISITPVTPQAQRKKQMDGRTGIGNDSGPEIYSAN